MWRNRAVGLRSVIEGGVVLALAFAGLSCIGWAQHKLYIPQFADGKFAGMGGEHTFRTTLTFRNLSSSATASLELRVFAQDGEVECDPVDGERPFCVSLMQLAPQQGLLGGRSRSFFLPVISPGGMLQVTTRGDQPLNAGWAVVEANVDIYGTSVYQIFREDSPQAISQTAIELTARAPTAFSIDINVNPSMSINTGVAISNPAARTAANLALTLRDSTGAVRGQSALTLAGYLPDIGPPPGPERLHNRVARYITELFPEQLGSGPFAGTLSVSSTCPGVETCAVVATAFRQVGLELMPVAVIPQ